MAHDSVAKKQARRPFSRAQRAKALATSGIRDGSAKGAPAATHAPPVSANETTASEPRLLASTQCRIDDSNARNDMASHPKRFTSSSSDAGWTDGADLNMCKESRAPERVRDWPTAPARLGQWS